MKKTKKFHFFIIVVLFISFLFQNQIFALWGNIFSPSTVKNKLDIQLGVWCFRTCKIYREDQTYEVNDIVAYEDNDGTFRLVRVKKKVYPYRHKHPKFLNKAGYASGEAYHRNDLWFEELTNTYVAFNIYERKDFVVENDQLYMWVGNHVGPNNENKCEIKGGVPQYDPLSPYCWGKPTDSNYSGRMFWKAVTTNLSNEEKNKVWNRFKIYYLGDEVYYPRNDSYISYADSDKKIVSEVRLMRRNLRTCTLTLEDRDARGRSIGTTEKEPFKNPRYWRCR